MLDNLRRQRRIYNLLRTERNQRAEVLKYIFFHELGVKRQVSLLVNGFRFHLRTATPDLSVILSCMKEEFRSLAFAFGADEEGLIIDAGGYIGAAAVALSIMFPRMTIVTVEPSTENISILKLNTSSFENIHVEQAAILDSRAEEFVQLFDPNDGEWSFTVLESFGAKSHTPIDKIPAISISRILEKYNFKEINILKMDVEGGEIDILKNPSWLASTKILVVELHERLVTGCEAAFFASNRGRFIYQDSGEKVVSVGSSYFNEGHFVSRGC
jgi:FkbM family methyltransferase